MTDSVYFPAPPLIKDCLPIPATFDNQSTVHILWLIAADLANGNSNRHVKRARANWLIRLLRSVS